ncbi:N-acetylglucosamine-6-phosphate deacetylase [Sulfitobacter sp. JBTF-M27]|uniref:N-acetylglucosamine-6-phosphate deacetylase n=1 Tax=Sulfitobacter sediminilitoris TaxID=2698830 RepID=A0A6P0CFJ8_9RHOB|nr:N-acetylglucosamine-6-phosphate deacetylase [Sulfitobacter sediminilitoris]NEK24008.1 N-acetylglucosamine-6-phosphate deacetylase [Sulfitobacter sediminilitoris]
MTLFALVGATIFDGNKLIQDHAVLIDGAAAQIIPAAGLPQYCDRRQLAGGTLMPGFVDLQVNGGGGVMFNADPGLATLETMSAAHRSLGTRAFLPTLITDTPEITAAAISAVEEAIAAKVPGILGLHLEGPHLSVARKGAHDARLIRPMTADDLTTLLSAADRLPNLMITLATESVTSAQITTLTQAGVIVSLGHSDMDYDTAIRAFEAGARCATHLFNAMSQLGSRTPGLVGAALDSGSISTGLIADAIHVHPATIRTALAAKSGPGEIFLVTDAMACAGSDITEFTLNDRTIVREDGRFRLADGTLAGADLSMARALEVMVKDVGDAPGKALARATSIPSRLLRDAQGYGTWPNTLNNLIYLGTDYSVSAATDLL